MVYTVGEMAKLLGVAASTLRYYDKEGLLPFVAPGLWRESLARMARLQDGQIRFVALGAIVIGLLLILV